MFNDILKERAHSDITNKYMCMSNKLGYFRRRIYHDDLHFHYVVFYLTIRRNSYINKVMIRKWYLIYFTVMSKIKKHQNKNDSNIFLVNGFCPLSLKQSII